MQEPITKGETRQHVDRRPSTHCPDKISDEMARATCLQIALDELGNFTILSRAPRLEKFLVFRVDLFVL